MPKILGRVSNNDEVLTKADLYDKDKNPKGVVVDQDSLVQMIQDSGVIEGGRDIGMSEDDEYNNLGCNNCVRGRIIVGAGCEADASSKGFSGDYYGARLTYDITGEEGRVLTGIETMVCCNTGSCYTRRYHKIPRPLTTSYHCAGGYYAIGSNCSCRGFYGTYRQVRFVDLDGKLGAVQFVDRCRTRCLKVPTSSGGGGGGSTPQATLGCNPEQYMLKGFDGQDFDGVGFVSFDASHEATYGSLGAIRFYKGDTQVSCFAVAGGSSDGALKCSDVFGNGGCYNITLLKGRTSPYGECSGAQKLSDHNIVIVTDGPSFFSSDSIVPLRGATIIGQSAGVLVVSNQNPGADFAENAVVIGNGAHIGDDCNINYVACGAQGSIAIGAGANVLLGSSAVAIGSNAIVYGPASIALGNGARAEDASSVAIGVGANAVGGGGGRSIAIGDAASAGGCGGGITATMAIGTDARAYHTVEGDLALATSVGAIGYGARNVTARQSLLFTSGKATALAWSGTCEYPARVNDTRACGKPYETVGLRLASGHDNGCGTAGGYLELIQQTPKRIVSYKVPLSAFGTLTGVERACFAYGSSDYTDRSIY